MRNRHRGFSLVELAVAVAIIALLLAGALIPLSAQIDVRNVTDTRRSMESISEAILGFAQVIGRLPCPANGSIPAGTAGAGTELFDGALCTATVGVLPWATLGTAEADGWGRRFSYRVSPVFADISTTSTWSTATTTSPPSPGNQSMVCNPTPAPGAPTSFALCSLGDIAVFTRGGASTTAVPLATALPAVIISHGKNGLGAWQANGTQLGPAPVGDEAANAAGTTQATPTGGYASWAFFSRTPTPAVSGCVDPVPPPGAPSTSPLCEFDDLVVMISSNVLAARMVAAGRLP